MTMNWEFLEDIKNLSTEELDRLKNFIDEEKEDRKETEYREIVSIIKENIKRLKDNPTFSLRKCISIYCDECGYYMEFDWEDIYESLERGKCL